MRALLLALATLLALACAPEANHVAATQTVVRIEADQDVRALMQNLRVRTAAPQGASWVSRNDKTFALGLLRWPVDIVVTPRAESEANVPFEVIAEALDAQGKVLVQARALSGFVRRQQRMLVLRLFGCGEEPLGLVCEENPACLGPTCSTCVEGSCAQSPNIPARQLPIFEPIRGLDAGGEEPDASMDAGAPADGSGDDGAAPDAQEDGQTSLHCDPGSDPGEGGTCLDVDECARGLDDCDHEPQACVNAAGGFSCACPSGYRGTGRGASGCADIDECMEQTASCDTQAACNNKPGGYACGSCSSGSSPGAGGACVDINECSTNNGGCDTSPMATCNNQVGAANTCSCPSGYTGNGVGTSGCSDINECSTNNGGCDTSPMATCNNQVGAANTCTCPTGYSGNGVGASGCVDPCSPNPCAGGLTCTRTAQATASCIATCASATLGCQLGDTCVTDADCRTGGDSNATCEATAKVCVTICSATTIISQANLDAARYCKEINGDLAVEPNFATIASSALPYLNRVRGSFKAGIAGGNTAAQSITIGNLLTIDGAVQFAGFMNLTLVSFPRLTTIGGKVEFILLSAALDHVSFPQLTSAQGGFQFSLVQGITQLDVGRLTTIGGTLTLASLCRLPWSQVSRIAGLVADANKSISNIGCCTMSSQQACSGSCTCN